MTEAETANLLRKVCPELRAFLEAELSAGNAISGGRSGGDWPWPDSVLIQFDQIFHSDPTPLSGDLHFQPFDHKKGEGDSISCDKHHVLVFAAMPTLNQVLSPGCCLGFRRQNVLESMAGVAVKNAKIASSKNTSHYQGHAQTERLMVLVFVLLLMLGHWLLRF